MRVLIAAPMVPHVDGGARQIVRWTAAEMRARGHEVEEMLLPFPTEFPYIMPALIGLRATPVASICDRLITIGWPSYLLRHDNKVTWFIHHYRRLFDLWDTPHRAFPDNAQTRSYRQALNRIDLLGLSECRQIFTISHTLSKRIKRFNGLDSQVLYHPLGGDLTQFRCAGYGDFIFYPSRVTPIKRQLLAIEAMQYTKTQVRLVIAGKPEVGWYEDELRDLVNAKGLVSKVDLRFGWLPDATKKELLSECLAVAYLPTDEDSYGYISLEAALSSKPIVTTTDSGGVLEYVRDGVEGLITEPEPRALAAAFDRLYLDSATTKVMGAASLARRAELGIDYDYVIPRLLGEIGG